MLDAIKLNMKTYDWKSQSYNWESISKIIARLERGHYQTKDVEIDLSVIDLSKYNFNNCNLFEFMTHYKLVEDSNLNYPVIVNSRGNIIDGRHRLCKAIMKGKKKLKWIMVLDYNFDFEEE